jgi:cellulose synthase/poly-beta-1,6-N-acetylglucosamine synthase-like glycosyltransferase
MEFSSLLLWCTSWLTATSVHPPHRRAIPPLKVIGTSLTTLATTPATTLPTTVGFHFAYDPQCSTTTTTTKIQHHGISLSISKSIISFSSFYFTARYRFNTILTNIVTTTTTTTFINTINHEAKVTSSSSSSSNNNRSTTYTTTSVTSRNNNEKA